MVYSNTRQRIAAISHQPVFKKSTFVFSLAIFVVFIVLAVIMILATAIILSSTGSVPRFANTMLIDAVYEFSLAALIFASARGFTKGNMLSVWLYAGSIILDILYNIVTGNPLNYLFIGFGLLLIWQILMF